MLYISLKVFYSTIIMCNNLKIFNYRLKTHFVKSSNLPILSAIVMLTARQGLKFGGNGVERCSWTHDFDAGSAPGMNCNRERTGAVCETLMD